MRPSSVDWNTSICRRLTSGFPTPHYTTS